MASPTLAAGPLDGREPTSLLVPRKPGGLFDAPTQVRLPGVRPDSRAPAPALPSEPDTVPIGVVLSQSGPFATEGEALQRGYEMVVERVNRDGGLRLGNRRLPVRLLFRDDGSDVQRATELANDLVQKDRVPAFLGPYSSGIVLALSAVANANQVPMVQAGGSAGSIYTKDNRFLFGVNSTTDKVFPEALILAMERARAVGKAPRDLKVAAAFSNNAFGEELMRETKSHAQSQRVSLALTASLPRSLETMDEFLDDVEKLQPDILLFSAYGEGARRLVDELERRRLHIPLIALTHCETAQLQALGPAAEYVLCSSQWDGYANHPDRWFGSSVRFLVEYELRYGENPPYQVAQGAAAAEVLIHAIEKAGRLDPVAIRDALASANVSTVFGPVRFDNVGRNVAFRQVLRQIQGGRYKMVWPEDLAFARLVFPMPSWDQR